MTQRYWLMTQKNKKNIILVLDLDDTLYKESDYVISGIKHIANLIEKINDINIKEELITLYNKNPKIDFLEMALILANLHPSSKESLLWSYRTHFPDIRLDTETHLWIEKSKKAYHKIAILTDGRSVTQRLKLAALGLSDLTSYISEEWASEKPDSKRFLAIQEQYCDKKYIYIGDNISKDFITPKKLNWITIGLKDNGRNIHPQKDQKTFYQPQYWVNYLTEIDAVIDSITC